MSDPVVVIGPGVRVVVREDAPAGKVYLLDAETVLQTDPETGELTYPFRTARIDGV